VNDPFHQPAQGLRKAVEAPVEHVEAGQADGAVHDPKTPAGLRRSRLPLPLELLRAERGIDLAEGEDASHGSWAVPLELLAGDDLDPLAAESLHIRLELEEVAAALDVGALGIREGVGEGTALIAPAHVVQVVGQHAVDRVADDVDHARLPEHRPDPGRDVLEPRAIRVVGRALAPDRGGRVEV
jgi:hypothetical protein